MAFGGLKGTLTAGAAAIPANYANSGSVSVAVGDLLLALVCTNNTLNGTAVTDNLGNSYTAQNAGTDNANACGRLWYSIATASGTLTAQTVNSTSTTNDVAFIGAVFEGVFSAVDNAGIANLVDSTTPFTCPSTGTLAQADELVIGWISYALARTLTATSPFTMAIQRMSTSDGATASVVGGISYRLVSATTAQIPEFTSSGAVNTVVEGTIAFKKGTSGPAPMDAGAGDLDLVGQAAGMLRTRVMPAAAGTMTLAGQTVVPRVTMPVTQGALSLIGQTVALRAMRGMAAVNGTLTLTGQSVALRAVRRLAADNGMLTLTGQPATFRRTYVMPASAGTVTLAGQLASLTKTGSYSLSAAHGALALTGQAATLTYTPVSADIVMSADAGAVALTGQAAALAYTPAGASTYTLEAEAGFVTIDGGGPGGVAVSVIVDEDGDAILDEENDRIVEAIGSAIVDEDGDAILDETGDRIVDAVAESSFETLLRADRRLPVTNGLLTLTGQSATLTYTPAAIVHYTIPAAHGALTLTGQLVGLSKTGAYALAAAHGTLTLTGQSVTLRLTRKLIAVNGTLTLSGQPVALSRGRSMIAGTGTLTLTGQSVTLRRGLKLVAANGTLTLTGQAANLVYGAAAHYEMPVNPGSITLTLLGNTRLIYSRRSDSRVPPSIRDYSWYDRKTSRKLARK